MTTITPRQLQRRLADAGATVPLATIARWSDRKILLALRWAAAQIDASVHDHPGTHMSVYWPPFLSAANTKIRH